MPNLAVEKLLLEIHMSPADPLKEPESGENQTPFKIRDQKRS